MTIDEELNILDDSLRRLKVEYDVFFGGGAKKPPAELEWRVNSLIKKFSDTGKLNFQQRFRYNAMAQKHAIFSDLWRQKLKVKEEGYRRPQDAMLGIQGLRTVTSNGASKTPYEPFTLRTVGPIVDPDQVHRLYEAMLHARTAAGESAPAGSYDSFSKFVHTKTNQLRTQMKCEAVEFSVEIEDGRVKLKAKAGK